MSETIIFATRFVTQAAIGRYIRETGLSSKPESANERATISENFYRLTEYAVFERIREYSRWEIARVDIFDYVDGIFGRGHEHLDILHDIACWLHTELYYIVKKHMGFKSWNIWHVSRLGGDMVAECIGDFRVVMFELEYPEWNPEHLQTPSDDIYAMANQMRAVR